MHYVLVCVAIVAMFALVAGCADLGSLAGGKTPPRAKHAEVSVAEFTPEEPREVKPRCECSRIDKPIVVDGDLSEWADIPAIVLDKAEFAKNDGGKWAGPQDCSGSMRMGYDSQWLYLAFDVTDDVFNQPFTGGEIWAGDCVQFAFDPLEERTKGKYAPNEQEYTVALTAEGPVLWRSGSPGPMKSAKVAIVRKKDSGGAAYEIGIPWPEMSPLAPGLMKSFGFTFCINDSDGGKGLKSWLEWTPGICSGKDPASFGQAAFTYVPPPGRAPELYVSSHIPDKPDLEDLKFRIFRFASADETLKLKLTLTRDGKEVASSTSAVAVASGPGRREVTWKISGLADGSYKGTITVEPQEGAAVERSLPAGWQAGFAYERVMTAPIRARAEAVKEKVARAAERNSALYGKNAPSIDYRVRGIDIRLASGRDVKTWRRLAELVAETEEIAEATLRGKDWFAEARGRFTRAYAAPEDDMVQPFRISVPSDYDGTKPYPLVVWLHGYGGDELTYEGWYIKHDAGAPGEVRPGYLVVNPYGRGNTGWRGWGRNDVWHVIDEMKTRYRIDENRVCVTGFSMGGYGTWYLATRYPDRWAAASPQAGGAGLDAWKKYANDNGTATDWRTRLAIANSEMFVLENYLDLPVVAWHGIGDGTVGIENTEAAFDRLRKLGYEAALLEGVRQGHEVPAAFRNATHDWMLSFKREAAPERVVYRTCDLRYNKAYWVEIDELVEDYRLSEVKATWREPGRIEVETKNVSRLTLELPEARLGGATVGQTFLSATIADKNVCAPTGVSAPPVASIPESLDVVVNGAKVTMKPVPRDRVLHLASADGGKNWTLSDEQFRRGRIKKHGVSGPLAEATADRFLVVYGTVGGDNATRVNRAEAEAFAKGLKGLTGGRMWGTFRVVADNGVTKEDSMGANLILFGGPESNACARKISRGLPVKVEPGKLTFRGKTYDDPSAAVKFIYPNPDAPERYVVVNCAATPEALHNIAQSSGSQPDWLVYDSTSAKRRGKGEGAPYAEGGFFDRDWK